jgi:alkanesulfonate monooxygenase SsuD/methylene tetrahydromethanopterin reductase-like flavin-dependent oxidoreductase (luciferase family)
VIAKRFGIFDHIEGIPGTPTNQLFKDRLTLIRMADEAGLYGYHLAEHHGSDLCMAPGQELFIADASQVTENIKLGPMVKLLPMHHPVRIIEDMCVLDHLTGGRLEYGVGRGAVPIEHYWFSQDWWESRDRFTDVLGIIENALASGELSSESSRFFDFPTMPMSTKPLQARIPFWYPGSPLTAGRHGMSLMWPGKISEPAYEQYLEAWHSHEDDEVRFDGPDAEPRVGYSMPLSIAPTEAEARNVSRRGAWRGSSGGRTTPIASTTSSCQSRNAGTRRARCGRSTPTWSRRSRWGPALLARSSNESAPSSTTGSSTTSASCSRPAT